MRRLCHATTLFSLADSVYDVAIAVVCLRQFRRGGRYDGFDGCHGNDSADDHDDRSADYDIVDHDDDSANDHNDGPDYDNSGVPRSPIDRHVPDRDW